MKLPSLEYIADRSLSTLNRFPLALASAALASLVSAYLIGLKAEEADFLYSVLLVLVLGIPLFTALPLIGEQRRWSRPALWILNASAAAVLLIYYFLLPGHLDEAPSEHLLRYTLYFMTLHLLVAVGPFAEKGKMNGFWQYNKTLFLRLLTAILFSGVLFIGLAVALGSIDVLFGVDIEGEIYLQLFVLITGIFNTWFFLAGVPGSLQRLESVKAYPKGLKVFTQHILIPLVTVYLIILYVYMGKIILEWSWPEGWVAYLVLSFSIAGLFALLLLHPVRENVENRWIRRFSRGYFWVLIPLVILLLLAIWVRIDEYGVTVNRYFVLVLGFWLSGMVGYFILSKTGNIKIIPASLGMTAFLISFGPWGAFSVAERSQADRLRLYMQENDILREGTVRQASGSVPFEDQIEISSILRYLNHTHGLNGIQPWFEQNLDSLTVRQHDSTRIAARHERPSKVAGLMGIEYIPGYRRSGRLTYTRHFSARPHHPLAIDEFDWIVRDIHLRPNKPSDTLRAGNQTWVLSMAPDSLNLLLTLEGQRQAELKLAVDTLAGKLLRDSGTADLPPERLSVSAAGHRFRAKAYFHSLTMGGKTGERHLQNAHLDLLLKINPDEQ